MRAMMLCGAVAVVLSGGRALAAEGMYLLDRLPAERLVKSGLKISVDALQRLSRAVVQVGSGGSGSFVSDSGLLVTNHHVAYRCLARLNSLKEHRGIMDRGYYAKTLRDEIACPGYDLRVVHSVQDVTAEMLAGIPAATRRNYSERYEKLRLRKERLRQRCEASKRYVCNVAEMDGGTAYYLSKYQRVRDVRLVYAPPGALGKFGGDVDNWMYPRHSADFTYLRAYSGEDGKGGAYAKDARPLKTPVHLKVSPYGIKRGSLVLVIGFPAHTSRHVTSHAVRFHRDKQVSASSELLEAVLKVLEKRMAASPDAKRKYAGLEAGLQNAIKYYRMMKRGFSRWNVLGRKLEQQQRLISAARSSTERKQAKQLLAQIAEVFAGYDKINGRMTALRYLRRLPSTIRVAYDLAKWGVEKTKPDRMRKDERYKDKNVYRFVEAAARAEREAELATERALTLLLLREAEKLPRSQRLGSVAKLLRAARRQVAALRREARQHKRDYPAHYRKVIGTEPSKDQLTTAVDLMYGRSRLFARSGDAQEIARAVKLRASVVKMSAAQINNLADPLLRFAQDLEAEQRALRQGPFKLVEQYLATALRPRWIKGVLKASYPDANSTVRLSLGSVQDYTSAETKVTHRYLTGLSGLLKKDTGRDPFRVPTELKQSFRQRMSSRFVDRQIKDIPVNFTTTLDTTGGNSGSAVLDDRGRLVGLLFDGTPESILSDWQYLPDQQRSICLDIRFAAYLASLRGAERLLRELGL